MLFLDFMLNENQKHKDTYPHIQIKTQLFIKI